MSSLAFLPSPAELGGLLAFVLGHPHLFVGSSSVMTSGIVALVAALAVVDALPRAVGVRAEGPLLPLLRWLAPKVALTLAYFGLGSLSLATQILIRFHASQPAETEAQFLSGVGHAAVAALGLLLLAPLLRSRSREEWITANFWALAYWTFHVAFLTPPWFSFHGQGELVLGAAKLLLGVGFALTLFLWRIVKETPANA